MAINEEYNQALEMDKIKSMLKKLPRRIIMRIYEEAMGELDKEEINNKLKNNDSENKKQNQTGSDRNAGGVRSDNASDPAVDGRLPD